VQNWSTTTSLLTVRAYSAPRPQFRDGYVPETPRQRVELRDFNLIDFTLEFRELAGVEIDDELFQLRRQPHYEELFAFTLNIPLI